MAEEMESSVGATSVVEERPQEEADWESALAEAEESKQKNAESSGEEAPAQSEEAPTQPNEAQAQPVEQPELRPPSNGGHKDPLDVDFILDIPLTVTVEVGQTQMLVQDLLQLAQGSVVELDKLVGEPMEVMVNRKLVARGEVVVVNERFGVRLTDIISPTERVRQLG